MKMKSFSSKKKMSTTKFSSYFYKISSPKRRYHPDAHLLNNINLQKLDSPNYTPKKPINFSTQFLLGCFSILHLNVRSMNKTLKS